MSMSQIINALEAAYEAIRERNPDVPAAIIVVGPGDREGNKLGHWAKESWAEGDDLAHELYLCADRLDREPAAVFGTLLHEAAHAIATARGVKDHSGQRHNLRFKANAEELGMEVERHGNRAWAKTSLTPATLAEYGPTIEALGDALKAYRRRSAVVRDPLKAYKNKVSSAKSMMRFLATVEPRVFAELLSELAIECPHCGEEL